MLSKNEEEDSSSDEDDCNPALQQNAAPKAKSREEQEDEMEVEDGWSVVRK